MKAHPHSLPPTMEDVAKVAKVHKTTVSRALRNSPNLPKATRERIQAIARSLGYRANPLVSALMENRRRHKVQPKVVLGMLNLHANPSDLWLPSRGFTLIHQGLKSKALEMGFSLDEIIAGPEMSSQRIGEIAHARGIQGLILTGNPNPGESKPYAPSGWEKLAAVNLGLTCPWAGIAKVRADVANAVCHTLEILTARSFRRIGFVSHPNFEKRVMGRQRGLFLHYWRDWPAANQVEPFDRGGKEWSHSSFLRWLAGEKPDVLLAGTTGEWCDWALAAGLKPTQIAILDKLPGSPFPGIEQQRELQGIAAVELLSSMLYQGDFGPSLNKATSVLIPGIWRD